jgi:predicted RecA/RadA family phage recombinase
MSLFITINQTKKNMKARFIHDGNAIDYVPAVDTPAGSVVLIGSIVGITAIDIAANKLGALHLTGVYDIEKDATAIPLGSPVYWKDSKASVTASTGSGGTLVEYPKIGVATSAAVVGDETVRVKIG